ncbi:hypothetical protein MAR_037060 [Mya arenaria]|uniref:Reverse transcriptase n=1 Tax=Mya arenaria TaxID=6604 RepID=A0ABY7FRQ1_MYAAR|nr:hypothetical protein MAR_037060 [Mya arenaria]
MEDIHFTTPGIEELLLNLNLSKGPDPDLVPSLAKTCPANYRPVSLACIVCKTIRHIVLSQIINHIDHENISDSFQKGFGAKYSCETQLLNTVENLSRQLEKRHTTDLLILEFQ